MSLDGNGEIRMVPPITGVEVAEDDQSLRIRLRQVARDRVPTTVAILLPGYCRGRREERDTDGQRYENCRFTCGMPLPR
jgi:hypothetical protein